MHNHMYEKPLHIISFDNPYPPVYGGIVEVYHKLKPLHDLGFSICLHCFVDDVQPPASELTAVTSEAHFYKNDKNPLYLLSPIPFSVRSRNSRKLLTNLNRVDAPILFEGLKTTLAVHQDALASKVKILRLHNIEHLYFAGIAKSERNFFRKLLFNLEAFKYKKYEDAMMSKFQKITTLSNYENDLVGHNAKFIPVFHGNEKVLKLDGTGKYALYHGDLRMSDNKRVVKLLVEIFKDIPDYPLVIASGTGAEFTRKLIGNSKNISYIKIDNFPHLQQLLADAHLNLIFSFQKSGTKLKLMNALYNSRFCIINENIIDDCRVVGLCEFASTKTEIIDKVKLLRNTPYTDHERRAQVLEDEMNDKTNAVLLAALIDDKWN